MIPDRLLSRAVFGLLASGGIYLAATNSATAAVGWQDIQFGGSLSQGYLNSTNNNYPVATKGGTFDFREYALNASRTFGTHFRVAAQVFGEKLGKYGDDKPVLDWAVADYNFRPEFGVQAGRLKFPRSMYSDVLDLDVVRPFILLPQSMYDNRLRDFQASFDGGEVYGSIALGQNSFDYKAYYGKIPMKTDSGVADFFNTTGTYKLPTGVTGISLDSVEGGTLTWNTPVSGLRVNAAYSKFTRLAASGPYVAMPTVTVSIVLNRAEYVNGGVEYTKGPWTLASEYQVFRYHTNTSIGQQTAYYVSVARKIGRKFEVGSYFDSAQNDHTSTGIAAKQNHRRDWAVAGRYDFNEHLLFKLECHYIDGAKDMFNVADIANPAATLRGSTFLFAAKTTVSF